MVNYTKASVKGNDYLKRKLQALEFAINETVLYLDAYPKSRRAMTYYHKLCHERNEVLEEYEKQVSPMTFYGNQSTDSWQWINSPWPWDYDAN